MTKCWSVLGVALLLACGIPVSEADDHQSEDSAKPKVIDAHCGLWQSRSARAPPALNELVLELDAAFADGSLESADQADPSQELTYLDIDTFLANFYRILDARQPGTLRPGFGIAPYFACIEGHVALLESLDLASLRSRLRRNQISYQ